MDANTQFADESLESIDDHDVRRLLQQIEIQGNNFDPGSSRSRKGLQALARSLNLALETPMESILRMVWAEPSLNAVVRTAINLKLFDNMFIERENAKSSSELAELTGSNPVVTGRILKHLASMEFIVEGDADMYCHSKVSKSMIDPAHRDSIVTFFDLVHPSFRALPDQLLGTEYATPTNPLQTAFQIAHQTPLHIFAWLQAHPEYLERFNNHMVGKHFSREDWWNPDCVDVSSVIDTNSIQDEDVLLVDVGGGIGQDLLKFHAKHPDLKGRLILQDLPDVVNNAKVPEYIEAMCHDFFTPQPIHGAKAYFLHSILHDWPEHKCVEILSNLIPALKRGYSKILISEHVIPPKGAHYITTSLDMIMMTLFAARERTEDAWRGMLDGVGLRIVRIWTFERGTESLIECELA